MLRRRMMMAQGGVSLPAGYTKLEYLESDGTQYIDTGFKPNQDTRVVMEASLLSLDGDQYLYGAKDTSSTTSFLCAYSDGGITFGYGSSFPSVSSGLAVGDLITIDQNRNEGLVNGTGAVTANNSSFQSLFSIFLCARNNGGEVTKLTKARIHSCRIYDNGTLIRDYIPAMNASGVSGLYDLVNDVFYPLQQVVTKVENRIYVYSDFLDNGDGTYSPFVFVEANHAVASNVVVTVSGPYAPSGGITITIWEGWTVGDQSVYLGNMPHITSISPTEDDTYIYTF